MTNHSQAVSNLKRRESKQRSAAWGVIRSIFLATLAVALMSVGSGAKELPEAPSAAAVASGYVVESTSHMPAPAPRTEVKSGEVKTIDVKFVSLALISTGSTFADSYTTLFARENWLAGKQGVCNMEAESAYLYGTHPTVGRAYAVATAKSVGSVMAAYYLRRHHSRFWSVPLVANSIIGLQGVTQNMRACN